MRQMARAVAFFVAAVFLGSISLASASPITPQEHKLVRAAKKEGAVTLLNPLFQESTAKKMGPAFAKRYGLGSSFKFQNVKKRTGDVVGTARAEMKAASILLTPLSS